MTKQIMNKEEIRTQMRLDAKKGGKVLVNPSQKEMKEAGLIGKAINKPVALSPKQKKMDVPMLTPAQEKARDLKELDKARQTIVHEVKSMETSYIKIGYALFTIREGKLYKAEGKYKNVYELASHEFGLSRGTCSDYISIIERFAKRVDGKVTAELENKFVAYKISSLMVMAGIKENDVVEKITPDMTVKEIKEEKKRSQGKSVGAKQEEIDVDYTELRTTLICEIKTYEEIADSEKIIRKLLESGKRVQIVEAWEEYHTVKGGE